MNPTRLSALVSAVLLAAGCPPAPKPDPIPATPKVLKFTAAPAAIAPTGKVTLEWEVTDASSVAITDVVSGPVAMEGLSGSVDVTPGASTLFVLSALNDRGAKATAVASVTVRDVAASRILFAAVPPVLRPGERATLVWLAPGAGAVSIAPSGGAPVDLGGQVEAGSVEIDPTTAESTWVLTADGQTRSVTVKRQPAVAELTTSTSLASSGDTVTIGWKSSFGDALTLSSPGRGVLFTAATAAEVAAGSYDDTLPQLPPGTAVTYVVTVRGAGGVAERSTSTWLGQAPVVTAFTAPDYAKTGSTVTLSWSTAGADAVVLTVGAAAIYQTATRAAAASGSVALPTPAADTTYTLEARSTASGQAATKTRTVQVVGAASITAFTATPGTLAVGGAPVTLAWTAPNARRVRVVESSGFVVATARGAAAETGTVSAYPNSLDGGYLLEVDNTIDAPVLADAGVQVATPATLLQRDGGAIFEAQGSAVVDWAIAGAALWGLPHADVVTTASSTGFVDISATGTKLEFFSLDDSVAFFTPAFRGFLYGVAVPARVNVSTNGFLTFSATAPGSGWSVGTFPSTSLQANFVAPLWADLYLDAATSGVFWEVLGEAPDQVLVVQWNKVKVQSQPASELTFEAKIHQTGVITFEHLTMTTSGTFTSVTGAQGPAGRGVTAATPTAGSSVVLFGPKTTPVAIPTQSAAGFLKIGAGYLLAPLPLLKATDVVISEAMYSPSPAVDAGEWFEVMNRTATPIELQGMEIAFGAAPDGGLLRHTIASSLVVPPNGLKVLGQTADTALNDGVAVDYAWGAGQAIDDTARTLQLYSRGALAVTSNLADAGTVGASAVLDPQPLLDTSGGLTRPTCTAPATLTYGTQSPLQRGGPGQPNGCFPRMTRIPVSFFDVSTSGTLLGPVSPGTTTPNLDSGLAAIDLSASPVTLFGISVTALSASTNGWLSVGTATTSGTTNKTQPSSSAPRGTLAPFWDDLDIPTTRTGAGMYAKRLAAGADPANPAPHWIIQWNRVTHYAAGDDLTFQVKLFDSGVVEYHYATMTSGSGSGYATGVSATVWLENPPGTGALPYSINQPNLTSNMAVRYAP